jgi:hypothetical protein
MLGVRSAFVSDSVVRLPSTLAGCLVSRHTCLMGGLTANFPLQGSYLLGTALREKGDLAGGIKHLTKVRSYHV